VTDKDLVALVGRENDQFLVWTVYIGRDSNLGLSRLTGAWVVNAQGLRDLHFWPQVLGVIASDHDFSSVIDLTMSRQLNRLIPGALVESIEQEIARLNEMYIEQVELVQQQQRKSTKPVAPRWPAITRVSATNFDLGSVHSASQEVTLEAAWWLKSLCDRWSEIEEIRLARVYMRDAVDIEIRRQPWISLTND
jgi:hypothetical protein